MECSLAYRARSEKEISQGVEIQHRDWELKNPSLAPHQEWDQQVGPTMTSLSFRAYKHPQASL